MSNAMAFAARLLHPVGVNDGGAGATTQGFALG